jgi:hypothetical protein
MDPRKIQEFRDWMAKVDQAIGCACGMSSEDLTDICYRDLFEAGVHPKAAAREALNASGYDFE